MPRRWTKSEESKYRSQLKKLYITENKSIREIAKFLDISEKTVFQRLRRLYIPTQPSKKVRYLNKRSDVTIPQKHSTELAEFIGILLGDGHITHFQTTVTLGNEPEYAEYVQGLMKKLFSGNPKICSRARGYKIVYLGSTEISSWLFKNGMVKNKVREQVDVPNWIFSNKTFMEALLRGFFDTDGSIYRLRFGIQIALSNRSRKLLKSLQQLLLRLEYSPSKVSDNKLYITRQPDIKIFFTEIKPQNQKHIERYKEFYKCVGTQAVNEDRL